MLNLINTLSLASALTLQPISETININISKSETTTETTIKSNLEKNKDYTFALQVIFFNTTTYTESSFINYNDYATKTNQALQDYTNIAIGYKTTEKNNFDISKYEKFNETQILLSTLTIYTTSISEFTDEGEFNIDINIRSKNFMEELLTALTTAVQSAVSIFVEGFGGLTQIFYNGTEITFIGGILIVGLAVMFLMMFLRWIVSFVKGIK